MPKNVQTATQLHSFHKLTRYYSKSFRLSFSSPWTENFQMYKLDLEKAKEPEIRLPTICRIIEKAREFQKTIYFCLIDRVKAFVWIPQQTGKILKEMGIPDHLTCLLRKLYVGQEGTVRTLYGTTNWFRIGGVWQGCTLPRCLFNLYAQYIMQNGGLDEAQARIKIARRNINNLRWCRWYASQMICISET